MASYETNQPKYKQSAKVKKARKKMQKVNANKPGTYKESSRVTDMYNAMVGFEATKPGAYQSKYSGQIDNVLNNILNREDFSYDMNADPLYQQYKQQYTQQGQQAMKDVMGNAAAMTGGYGNSYASTVGSQAYQGYLGQLNDKALDLYQIAYQKYRDQGANMYNQLGALQSIDDVGYSRYRDTVNDWYADRDYKTSLYQDERDFDYGKYQDKWNQYNLDRNYYTGRYQDERDFDYGRFQDNRTQWNTDRAYGYQKDYDAQQQANWAAEYAYQQQRDAQQQANWAAEFAYQQQSDAADLAYRYAAMNSRGKTGTSEEKTTVQANKGGSYPDKAGYLPFSQNTVKTYENNVKYMSRKEATEYIQNLLNDNKITKAAAGELFKYWNSLGRK